MKMLTKTNLEQQILVFKTNIRDQHDLLLVEGILNYLPGISRWTVDLDDWEKVLKVEADNLLSHKKIEEMVTQLGFFCKELDH